MKVSLLKLTFVAKCFISDSVLDRHWPFSFNSGLLLVLAAVHCETAVKWHLLREEKMCSSHDASQQELGSTC